MRLSSIKTKLTLIIALILLATALLLVGMSYWNTREILLTDTQSTLTSLAQQNADKLALWLKARAGELAVMANTPEVVSGERAAAIAWLKDENRRNPLYAFFFLVDMEGNAELTTGAKPKVADRPYFQQARSGKIAISDPLLSKVDGQPLVVIATPIRRNGQVSGVLAATVTLRDMIELVNRIKVGKTGYAYVIQRDGLTIFHPDAQIAMHRNELQNTATDAALNAILGRMIKGEEGAATYMADGKERYAAFAPVAGTPWSMAVNVPTAEMTGRLGNLLRSSLLVLALSLAVAVVFVLFVAGRFSRPLETAVEMIEGLGRGELERRLNLSGADEVARLGQNLDAFADNMQNEILAAFEALAGGNLTFEARGVIGEPLAKANRSLNEVMAQIQNTSEQIASNSVQVADSSQALSQGATVQASSLEQISASLHQMASQTTTNAENAGLASSLATEARSAAEEGSRHMEAMVSAMNEINTAGQNINKIIKTIDEIAFQTNLLALNAAVEAARAGQHGKGFAVVAEEVRNLAARSAKAAEETAQLIEGSVEKTRNGSAIAEQTAEALGRIVSGVTKVTDLAREIATANHEQAQGIAQISQGLGQVDQVTQQNTARTEESAAAAEELSNQAAQLQQMLQRFVLLTPAQNAKRPVLPTAPERISWVQPPQPPQPPQPTTAASQPQIALDDEEFGKY